MTRRIYLSGPMTGLHECNRQAFNDAEQALRSVGFDVFNPVNNGLPRENTLWETHMRADIAQLMECDCVAVLPGAQHSRGSRLEIDLALQLGITPVRDLDVWLGKECD